MTGFRVGFVHNTIHSRYGAAPFVRADFLSAVAAGADSFFVGDHLNGMLPRSMWHPKYVGLAKLVPSTDANLEPWTMLGYLAAHNKPRRLRLGVAVTDTGRRNPAVTAQAVTTLHHLTRGRAILGIGTGEREGNEPYGVDWTKPVARFEEALATIRALWNSNGEPINRESSFFPLHNAIFALPPYKGKYPPIWVASAGPRMLRATGKYADGWFPASITQPKYYGDRLAAVKTAASDAGRDPGALLPAAVRFIITASTHTEIDAIVNSDIARIFMLASPAEAWARHGAQHPLGADFTGFQDLVPQTIDEQSALRYAAQVPRSLIEESFAVGTPEEVVEQFAEWRDNGLRYAVLGNAGAVQPSLRKSMTTTASFAKAIKGLKRL